MIEAEKYEKCEKQAREFLMYLMEKRDIHGMPLSHEAYTFAIMTILKTNELAKIFCENRDSFDYYITKYLDGPCLEKAQIGYNVMVILWILSYHDFAQHYFEDYTLAIIEKSSKVLDFFSWEKIARIMLLLFDNLKENPICQEHLSDIDALSLIVKLQNRHWIDSDINDMLEKMYDFFDANQKVFSSLEKFANQVHRKQLRWGPCHTEKFWQENAVLFDKQGNLSLITIIVNECLSSPSDNVKAVACFDLGEFCRFYPHGKGFLEKLNVKQKMTDLMRDAKTSAEVKKEAITCYQKMLMNSWSS